MSTKLTLTLDEAVIRQAKNYARKKGRSLSGIVENYLKAISGSPEYAEPMPDPVIHGLRGAFKSPEKFEYRKELTWALSEKYLRNEPDSD